MPTLGIKPSFAGGELSPREYARVDLAKYGTSVKTLRNFIVHPHGGASNRPGTEYVGVAPGQCRLIPFQFSTVQSYMLVFYASKMRVLKGGGWVLETAKNITGITKANPAVVTSVSHGFSNGDLVYLTGVVGMTEANGKFFTVANKTADTFELASTNSSAYTDYASGGTAARVYTATSPYAYADLAKLKFTQSADTMFLAHPSYQPYKLTRSGHASWSFTALTFGSSVSAPSGASGLLVSPFTSGTARDYYYYVTAIGANGEESPVSSKVTMSAAQNPWPSGAMIKITWSAVSGAVEYNVYKNSRGNWGWIGTVPDEEYIDDNVDPDVSRSIPDFTNPFASSTNYPGAVALFQQRSFWARTDTKPNTVWGSRTANLYNTGTSSPLQDDDAIEATVASLRVDEIRHMVPLRELLLLTAGSEWIMRAGSNSDALTPTSVQFALQSYNGSSDVPPLVINDTVLHVLRQGKGIRDIYYQFEADGYKGYDRTLQAEHLFRDSTIKEWAYQQSPDSVIWTVMADGTLRGFTYLQEHEVFAWHRHDSGTALFESVASISTDDEDEVYFVVKRSVNGSDVRYIEKLSLRDPEADAPVFCDCALIYSGTAATVISGLEHLEDEDVAVIADGAVIPGLTVASGAITLPAAAENVVVGLPYTAELETLGIDMTDSFGTAQGRRKRISRVTVRLEQSRGGWLGPTSAALKEFKYRTTELYGEAVRLFTGDKQLVLDAHWSTDGRLFFRQADPLPVTILALIPEVDLGE